MSNRVQDMTPAEIRKAMIDAQVTQSGIARSLNPPVTPSAVYRVIEGTGVSHRIRQALANATGIDIKRIWPSVYLSGGPRKAGRPYSSAAKKDAA
jgi:lambda repressor-like predicted transcriptional regulator